MIQILKNKSPQSYGICCECPNCHAIFLIEEKKDISAYPVMVEGLQKCLHYYTTCPICNEKYDIGVDWRDTSNFKKFGIHPSFYCDAFGKSIFDRSDWEEKFKMSLSEAEERIKK